MPTMIATYTRIESVIGSGSSQTRRSGNTMAAAISTPKIAPDAPIVGTVETSTKRSRNQFSSRQSILRPRRK